MTIIDIPVPEVQTTRTIDLAPLIKARLRNLGWRQHTYGGPEGPNCVMGAVGRVIRGLGGDDVAVEVFDDLIRERLNGSIPQSVYGWEDIEEWNDHYGRTVEEVFALLDSADLKVSVYE